MAATNVADQAVAVAAMTAVLDQISGSQATDNYANNGSSRDVVEFLVGEASRVQFRPSTRQLVLTYDLAFGTPEDASGPVA